MQKWMELSKAKNEFDMDFDCLYDMVINGSVKSKLSNDEVLVDMSSFKKAKYKTMSKPVRPYNSLKEELEIVKEEYIWLKSENLRNDRTIKEYYLKFTELKSMNKNLMDIIAQQAAEIRSLKGYSKASNTQDIAFYNKNTNTHLKRNGLGVSLWMMFPVLGLFLTALVELVRTYHVVNLTNLFKAFGM